MDCRFFIMIGAVLLLVSGAFFAPAHSQDGASGRQSAATDASTLDLTALTNDELMAAARTAFKNGHFAGAELLYQALLVRERQNVEAILELATVYEQTGKFEYVRGLLQRAAVLRPNDKKIQARNVKIGATLSIALHEQIDSLVARKQYSLALPKLSILLTIEPENPLLHYKKAFCHLELQSPEMALRVIDDALKLQKNEAFYKLRAAAVEVQKKKTILEYVMRTIDLMKTGSEADNHEALQHVGNILQIDPEHEWAKKAFVRLTGDGVSQQAGAVNDIGIVTLAEPEDTLTVTDRLNQAGASLKTVFGTVMEHIVNILLVLASVIALITVGLFLKRWIFTSNPPLTGKLSHFSLQDILSFLNTTARTGLVKVRAKTIRGDIYFENGETRHCKAGKQEGIKALDSLLAEARDGHFSFIDAPPSFKKTIDTPLSLLLMGGYNKNPSKLKSRRASKNSKSRMKELLDSRK